MTKWTKQQNDAICARNRNILVSAAAGSGKTAVLVERVIRLITDEKNPVDVDRFLVVTFTKAAAQEMKARISSSLEDIIKKDPSNMNALRQMSLLPSAKISTIDAFCLDLVKDNFFEVGINQDFTFLDNSEADILEETALSTVLDSFFENDDKDFLSLVELFSSPKDDSKLIEYIKKIYTYIYAQPFPLKWLGDMTELYDSNISLEKSVWYENLLDELRDGLNCGKNIIEECFDFIDPDDEEICKYDAVLHSDLDVYNYLLTALDTGFDNIISSFQKISFMRMPRCTSPLKGEIFSRRDIYKNKILSDLKGMLCASADDYKSDMQELYLILKKLCEVVSQFDNELKALKDERNGYTFSDVLHFAINLLVTQNENGKLQKTKLANDLQDNFYEILVDEYQDTNESQDMLFKMLSNGNNRFMVGDVKQSIYRFRIAMPFIFTSKKNRYQDYIPENEYVSSRIILDKNFRSKKDVCDYVNYVFSAFMTEKTGELDYDESEYLNYGAEFDNNDVPSAQIKILQNEETDEKVTNEAIYIAKTIKRKVESGELIKNKNPKSDDDKYRPIKYGDFAILLRSVKNSIDEYNEVLTTFGVPVVCDNSNNLFESNEIKTILSLLRVIDNPMQDISLLAVMMSPLYGFTADEMAEIKLENNNLKLNLYTSVVNSNSAKVKAFLEEIDLFSKLVVTMSVSSFIRFVCDYKSMYAFANALGNGQQRSKNINKFIEFAAAFDNSDSVGLTSFMRYIDKIIESGSSIEGAKLNPSAEDAVTIMSVHHSKGLEFPVVIYAGASRQYNTMDLKEKLMLNPFMGLGVRVHNESRLYDCDTIPYVVVKKLNKTASMSENLRVLYVAMTRAKEQFISFITVPDIEKKVNSLSPRLINGHIDPYLCRRFISDSDILLLSALTHQNGSKLRKYSEVDVKTVCADFPLDVEILYSVDDIEEIPEESKAFPNKNIVDEIKNKLSYKYENDNLSVVQAKRTASSLDESIKNLDFFASSKPAFMSENGMTPGEKGTAMHTFMQFCNYQNAKDNLETEIERLFSKGFINEKQKDCLDSESLNNLFKSAFADRMFNSENIYREIKVSSFVPAKEIEDTPSTEKILVQGISDCVFEENGKLVLVDYKTDRVKSERQLLDMYKNQIAFYAKAVSKTLQKEVKEAVLYSFYLGKPCYYELF